MRANESLPLTSQADAAFLLQFAKLGMGIGKNVDQGQLLRTLKIIRTAAIAAKKAKDAAPMEVVA